LKRKSHGLDVTARRIKNFNSDALMGDAVSITDLFAADGSASGTQVMLKLALIKNTSQLNE
jgi:hypothetical protein